MTQEEIQNKVIELAAAQGGVAPADVTREVHLVNDLNYDSLDEVEFGMAVEDEFGISIPEEKMQEVKTVGGAIDLVVERVDAGCVGTSRVKTRICLLCERRWCLHHRGA